MRFYGTGQLLMPLTKRVVWDFSKGPFDTVNQQLIEAAKKQGFTNKPVEIEPVEPEIKPKDTPKKRKRSATKKRGKAKGAKNVNT